MLLLIHETVAGIADGFTELDRLVLHTFLAALMALPFSAMPLEMRHCVRIKAEACGLHSYPAFYLHRFLAWDDIEVVGPIHLLSLRYLRLRSIFFRQTDVAPVVPEATG